MDQGVEGGEWGTEWGMVEASLSLPPSFLPVLFSSLLISCLAPS